jgi:phosphatidylglycerol---prolipoprotein diacylglyceryl transferase
MRPYFVELLNRLFGTEVFTYLVPNYAIMLSLGALAGTLWAARRARRMGLDPDVVYGLALWGFPAALLGGRLMSLLYASEAYGGSILAFFDPLIGDSVAYGGFIAGTATVIVYLFYRRVEIWRYLDCAVPGVGLGTFFTRLGCFLDGDDFGSVTSSPLAVSFPAGSFAYLAHVDMGLLSPSSPHSLPVHPVQLYLAVNGLILAAAAAYWSRRGNAAAGEAFSLYWLLYSVTRFGIEFLRGDLSRGFLGPLSTSQITSIPIALLCALLLWHRFKNRLKEAE